MNQKPFKVKNPQVSNTPNKVYTVGTPDMQDESNTQDVEMNRLRKEMEKAENAYRSATYSPDLLLEKELKRREVLDKLVLFKRPKTKVVEVDGIKFLMKILTPNENASMMSKFKDLQENESLTKTSAMILAYAIVNIDGNLLEDIYSGPSEIVDPVMKRYYELSEWNITLITILSEQYSKFTKELDQEYRKSFLVSSPPVNTKD